MFSEELKAGTAIAHLDLEKKMIPHLKKIGSKIEYTRLLDYMLGFYRPLEERLAPYMKGFAPTSHAANILRDISAMDPDFVVSTDEAKDLPQIGSDEKALGVLYVLEGSTLGGQVISKMLTKQLEADGVKTFNFYNPYGDETMQHWKSFKQRLDKPFGEMEKQAIIAGANETFDCLKSWISAYESKTQSIA